MPPGSLPLLAALTPAQHRVTLIDENVEAINFDEAAQADVVGVTGLNVQRLRMREILTALKERGAFTVVGGPWVTVQEDYFGDLADVIFVGEAEETWPRFLRDWQDDRPHARYEQAGKTDLSTMPTPRFDLMKMQHYLFGGMQFSRGCPFLCEFCDIIVTFGRRPRLKTGAQVDAELDALRARDVDIVFIVDDNLVGNKTAIKGLLRDLIAYQEAHGYFFSFFTEASLDLAEDDELLRLLVQANIVQVFVGIESPNEASLRETRKYQNVRPGRSMLEKVWHIQEAGLEVMSGMILGFDQDDAGIFAAQRDFVTRARIVNASAGMLHAIPKTPLYERLAREGRLDPADDPEYGTNVIPLRLTRQELSEGYIQGLDALYEAAGDFSRLDELYLHGKLRPGRAVKQYWRRHPWACVKALVRYLGRCLVLYRHLLHGIPEAWLRREYRRRLRRALQVSYDPSLVLVYLLKIAMHYHMYTRAREMAEGRRRPFISA